MKLRTILMLGLALVASSASSVSHAAKLNLKYTAVVFEQDPNEEGISGAEMDRRLKQKSTRNLEEKNIQISEFSLVPSTDKKAMSLQLAGTHDGKSFSCEISKNHFAALGIKDPYQILAMASQENDNLTISCSGIAILTNPSKPVTVSTSKEFAWMVNAGASVEERIRLCRPGTLARTCAHSGWRNKGSDAGSACSPARSRHREHTGCAASSWRRRSHDVRFRGVSSVTHLAVGE